MRMDSGWGEETREAQMERADFVSFSNHKLCMVLQHSVQIRSNPVLHGMIRARVNGSAETSQLVLHPCLA